VIDIKGMTFSYPRSGRTLFDSFDLTLSAGNIVGLLGKNGAGKTTLLKIITGLQFAGSGTVVVNGLNPAQRPAALLADTAVIPEELASPAMSMGEYSALHGPLYPRFDRSRMIALMAEFGLPAKGMIGALSYGQKKKFFLAFGLASNCRLLILDEPTNGLDIPSKVQFRNLLSAYRRPDRLIIISTHQVRDVDDLIDSVIVLENGAILLQESMGAIAERMVFGVTADSKQQAGALYSEAVPGGTAFVLPRTTEDGGKVDLELLFNAVTAQPEAIRRTVGREA
jgi:ABC-2 type transport system ATP-binding protein